MKKNFSVLMSVYYKEKPEYLNQSIESILNQTVKPKEIVIVKDGPLTNELEDVIKKYKVKEVQLEKNVGLGKALKIGVENCKYELIARMDSDDISVPNRFELELKEFKKNPNLTLVGGQVVEFNELGLGKKRKVPEDMKSIIKYSKKRNPFNHMTVMFKKKDILNVGNYKHMPFFEDYYLWILLIKNNYEVLNLSEILAYVRSGEEMTKRRGGIKYIQPTYNFEREIYRLKYIKLNTFLVNIFIRGTVSLVPNKVRRKIYTKVLRE